jgi:hypothetical protein
MATWSTLHILHDGETILIKKDLTKSILSSELTKVQAVVDNLYSFNPEVITETKEHHSINIIKDKLGVWISKKAFKLEIEYAKLDIAAIDELVAEIEAYGEAIEESVVEEAPATEETPAAE